MSQNNTIHIIGFAVNSEGNLPGAESGLTVYEAGVFEVGVYQ